MPVWRPAGSALARQSPALHLAQRLGAAKKGNSRNHSHYGQGLEQVPRAIVQQEDALHGHDGPEKQRVRDGRVAHGLLRVGQVASEQSPLCAALC